MSARAFVNVRVVSVILKKGCKDAMLYLNDDSCILAAASSSIFCTLSGATQKVQGRRGMGLKICARYVSLHAPGATTWPPGKGKAYEACLQNKMSPARPAKNHLGFHDVPH